MGKWGVRVGGCCPVCHGQFVKLPSNPKSYCSKGCADVALRAPPRICHWCSAAFSPNYGVSQKRNEGRFCSRACRALAQHWESPLHKRVMEALGASRVPRQIRTPCRVCARPSVRMECGPACRREWVRQKTEKRDRSLSEAQKFTCRECGSDHVPEYADKRRTFCSRACARRYAKRVYGDQHKNHRKRARHYAVAYEPIDRNAVFSRDGWRCGICGERIDRRAQFPHPRSASLDHIVPISRGGGHVYHNVQAAHFMCNSVKGAGSSGSQLRMAV